MRLLNRILAVAITALAVPCVAQMPMNETRYNPPSNETNYNARMAGQKPAGTETTYNTNGTIADSGIALISTRRTQGEFRAFLSHMQSAHMRATTLPFNVAPLKEGPLEAQAMAAAKGQASMKFLVDAPKGADATQFLTNALAVSRRVAVFTEDATGVPAGVPVLRCTPEMYGEAAAAEAIVAANGKMIVVLHGLDAAGAVTPSAKAFLAMVGKDPKTSMKAISIGPKTTVQDIEKQIGEEANIGVIVVADDTVAIKAIATLERMGNANSVIAIGETPQVMSAFERGAVTTRIKPNHAEIVRLALEQFSKAKVAEKPIDVRPVAESRKNAKKPAKRPTPAAPAPNQPAKATPTPKGTPRE